MILSTIWENPAIVGLIVAVPTTVLGYLGYRRSRGIDEAAKQAGLASSSVASVSQVVDGLNRVISALQEDNKVLRGDIVDLRAGVELCQARLDVVEEANNDLLAKNRELEREITELKFLNQQLRREQDG